MEESRSIAKLEQLNFHHLLYFWVVAEEGSVTAASRRLGLAQPSVSSQVRRLEERIGGALFDKSGRGRVLSPLGREVYGYANRIFAEGQAFVDYLNGRPSNEPIRLVVGVPDSMPKLVAHRLLKPVYEAESNVELRCHSSRFDDLLSDLALHRFDVVLSNTPVSPHVRIRAFNHRLGESPLMLFAAPRLAEQARKDFPKSINSMPILLPSAGSELRRAIDHWMQENGVTPRCSGEFYDSALMKEFGGAAIGLFAIPGVIAEEVCRQYGVEVVGEMTEARNTVYAITQQKRITHPGVRIIVDHARDALADSRAVA